MELLMAPDKSREGFAEKKTAFRRGYWGASLFDFKSVGFTLSLSNSDKEISSCCLQHEMSCCFNSIGFWYIAYCWGWRLLEDLLRIGFLFAKNRLWGAALMWVGFFFFFFFWSETKLPSLLLKKKKLRRPTLCHYHSNALNKWLKFWKCGWRLPVLAVDSERHWISFVYLSEDEIEDPRKSNQIQLPTALSW